MDPLSSYFAHPRGPFGRLAGAIMAVENRRRNAWAVSCLGVDAGDRVLEIGFGPGTAIARLVALVADGRVAGVDASAEMVAQAGRRNAAGVRDGRIDLRLASVAALPFADGAFDRALAVNSLHRRQRSGGVTRNHSLARRCRSAGERARRTNRGGGNRAWPPPPRIAQPSPHHRR